MFEVLYQNLISGRLQEALGGPGRLQEGLLEAAGGSGRPWEAPEGSPGGSRRLWQALGGSRRVSWRRPWAPGEKHRFKQGGVGFSQNYLAN